MATVLPAHTPLPWQLHALGTVQAAGPEALGTFLTFALVSYSSRQSLAGLLSPQPCSLKCPIVLPASWLGARALLAPSSPSGLPRGRCQPRNECGGSPAWFGPVLGLWPGLLGIRREEKSKYACCNLSSGCTPSFSRALINKYGKADSRTHQQMLPSIIKVALVEGEDDHSGQFCKP